MKLEYVYNNNSNLKYILKVFCIFGFAIILIVSLMLVCIEKNVDYFFISMFAVGIILIVVVWDIVFLIVLSLRNNYKRKQFISIKENGKYCEGIIIMANSHFKGYGRHKWLWKDSGEITVSVENKTYTITDIDYNYAFKLLEQKINDDFDTSIQHYINFNQQIKSTSIFGNVYRKEITIGIYLLDNNVVADLDSFNRQENRKKL